jgi:chromosomal replication initiator protein
VSLSSAIKNMVFSADSSVDSEGAIKKLENLRKSILGKTERSGRLYEARLEMAELSERKNALSELHKDLLSAETMLEKIKANIRQLEGAVKKINALVNIEGSSINIAIAQNAIRDIMTDSRPVSSIVSNIISETSRTFGVPQADIISKKKDAKTARARQVAIYIVREITDLTQKEISEYFGGRDRTTILYSVETIAKDASNDSSLQKTIDKIIKNVQEQ